MNRLLVAVLVVLVATTLASCGGSSLTDAQVAWCRSHDATANIFSSGDQDNAVLVTAKNLGITVPQAVLDSEAFTRAMNLGLNPPEPAPSPGQDYGTVMASWRKSADYARACIAAFDSR